MRVGELEVGESTAASGPGSELPKPAPVAKGCYSVLFALVVDKGDTLDGAHADGDTVQLRVCVFPKLDTVDSILRRVESGMRLRKKHSRLLVYTERGNNFIGFLGGKDGITGDIFAELGECDYDAFRLEFAR